MLGFGIQPEKAQSGDEKESMTASETPRQYFMRTARLGFGEWRTEDSELACALWGDPEVTEWIDARGSLTPEQIEQKLENEIRTAAQHGVQYWPLFLLENDANMGCCGLRPYDLPGGTYEIGFHIGSAYWRRGYAIEAAGAVIGYAFRALEASALFAGHNPGNEASRDLLIKLGFRYTHDEYYPPTGLDHPSYLLRRVEMP